MCLYFLISRVKLSFSYSFVVFLSHLEEIVALLGEFGLKGEVCLSRQAGREKLFILRFNRREDH